MQPVRRALISVFDKTDLVPFALALQDLGIANISTGGTAKALRSAGIAVKDVSTLTNAPEILGGRVKSLHPNIHGGILHRRNDADDLAELEDQDIRPIDLVVVNLYPFEEATRSAGVTDS